MSWTDSKIGRFISVFSENVFMFDDRSCADYHRNFDTRRNWYEKLALKNRYHFLVPVSGTCVVGLRTTCVTYICKASHPKQVYDSH